MRVEKESREGLRVEKERVERSASRGVRVGKEPE